jgi:transposase
MAEKSLADLVKLLGHWEGFDVVGFRSESDLEPDALGDPAPRLILELKPTPDYPKRCSRCGEIVVEIHDVSERRVRDLPIGEWDTWLIFPRARLQCPRCGPTVERVPWVDRYQRMTTRLAEKIAKLSQRLSIKHVAEWFGVSWDTVKQIDKRALLSKLGEVEDHLDGVRVITIDEFAIQKGHRYATVIVDVPTKRVLWICRDRNRESIRGFFLALGPERCALLEAAAVDMWKHYRNEILAHCPQVKLVYDLFHVVAKYGREVVDRVRVDETNRLARAAGPGPIRNERRVIKGARWLLLRNREHVTKQADRVRLRELLEANTPLFITYLLKDDLKQLWQFRYPKAAWRFWHEWRRRAIASGLKPLLAFTKILEDHIEGIINHCTYPINSGMLEGMNNKIKVIKRTAYGFRDDAYFFLKIRAAFPGIAR